MDKALILFAHGARDPEWAAPLRRVQQLLAERNPGLLVELAFLEFMSPTLDQCIEQLSRKSIGSIVILPMFIAQGGHLKRELPEMLAILRHRHPLIDIRLERAIGEDEAVLAAMADAAIKLVTGEAC